MCELHFDESLILKDIDVNSREELLRTMAANLFSKGLVKESFIDAVIEREKTFPTGLPTNRISVAIPHTDSEHVNKKAISIAILKEPVKFGVMGEMDADTPVQIVFMLAIDEKDSHLVVLQKLMELFQNEEELQFLILEENKTNIKKRLTKHFQIQ
ncbi:putative PTS IIA-like nitrogen-regulatory protein PtsN [Bacillus methanolicus PB1]|uniref:Putative PTS IIA-like nitrogen-regulatory protein PtsN n=1 Tax=Bacillus methanolicus PB1 TaxID=997296 RepID=I3DUQ5_BACMT|nr:PTS sugar transporter subunit IIA [Bacillus methanolicus]EIJ77976.1 putative PTS IIA-like nitrogen-regulatory protein PtsN [Bacillus methanolicus PB1]